MHDDQLDIPAAVVHGLVAGQFPEWAALPVRPIASNGTVNALFRLGDNLVARLPFQPRPAGDLRVELIAEMANARWLAERVSTAVPEPVALGEPGPGFPMPWAIYRWLPGNLLTDGDRLAAVIDVGAVAVRDPAVDLAPAWNLLGRTTRAQFRAELQVAQPTWDRGRGWCLVQAITALYYYVDSNPAMTETARRTLQALLDDDNDERAALGTATPVPA